MKEAILKRLYTMGLYLYDILGETKTIGWRTDNWLPGFRNGTGRASKEQPKGIFWNVEIVVNPDCGVGYTKLIHVLKFIKLYSKKIKKVRCLLIGDYLYKARQLIN